MNGKAGIKMKPSQAHKLLLTIVKKSEAKLVVRAAKEAGARGATVLLAKGSGIHEKKSFLGIPLSYEKEVVLTIAPGQVMKKIANSVTEKVQLNQSGKGIGMVINLENVLGIVTLAPGSKVEKRDEEEQIMSDPAKKFDLIVTIVNRGDASKVVDASLAAGAEGATVLSGRGSGIHEKAKLFNIQIEPEKEIVLTLIHHQLTKHVAEAIETGVELNQSGKGIAFILDVERVIGINHLIEEIRQEEQTNREKE
ncbi:P-II family nitrogen regulator [Alkalihalobacillus oceani]|uniref:P-II family nitrogen regulator n=1 Tax=Halalkalibacter oceani TaxID=1653776 RepID=A0A9X2INT2_9BACI|nr:P-II family nitrogen regulator [Halalkalibacter oceani]MCM3713707.1 P-II family nitrogen regulator [Halalkalibacter oceani]